jgi:hypothetical protein
MVLISCHGKSVDSPDGPQLVLELADGALAVDDVFPERVVATLVILSACESGVYHMAWSDRASANFG